MFNPITSTLPDLPQIALTLRFRALSLVVLEKLTCTYLFQISLEIIPLPVQANNIHGMNEVKQHFANKNGQKNVFVMKQAHL